MGPGMMIESVVNNGTIMTKAELLEFFSDVLHSLKDFKTAMDNKKLYSAKISALERECKRRIITFPEMHPPKGFKRFSRKANAEYRRWLDDASKRKEEMLNHERDEDDRIALLQVEISEFKKKYEEESAIAERSRKLYELALQRNVLSDRYMQPQILMIIVGYILSSRAHTLTDALNIYHQEAHWNNMEQLLYQQAAEMTSFRNDVMRYQKEQMDVICEMAQNQERHMADMERTLDEVNRNAQGAKFYSKINFLFNLYDHSDTWI